MPHKLYLGTTLAVSIVMSCILSAHSKAQEPLRPYAAPIFSEDLEKIR